MAAATSDPLRLTPMPVEPVAQAIWLQIEPEKEAFAGRVVIDVVVHESVKSFRLHGEGLTVSDAKLVSNTTGTALELTVEEMENGILAVTAAERIETGRHRLEIVYGADFRRDGVGIYKTVSRDRSYIFTQMEGKHARRGFPSWDAPEFKIPWQLTLKVPAGMAAYSNAGVAIESVDGDWRTIEFCRTPPMSSYLVALAVGPFETVPVTGMSVPGRIIVPQGQAKLAGEVAKRSETMLRFLEDYFGVPYPYGKLDQIAVPEYLHGGMENAGLITYLDSVILLDPQNTSQQMMRVMNEIVAHELAHMWFGDLVTMEWWDDLWLNESFANWMERKVVMALYPELRADISALAGIQYAMRTDALASTHPVKTPVSAKDDPDALLDALTYSKGQAVIEMVESWIGAEAFQRAMKRYFERHRWGNTEADDLWAVFDEEVGGGVTEMASSFVLQAGIPVVTFERAGDDQLRISQERLTTLGSSAPEEAAEQTWVIPVVFRYSVDGDDRTARLLLDEQSIITKVPDIGRADWLHANADESGYYRSRLGPGVMPVGAGHLAGLAEVERYGMLDNARALLEAGMMDGGDYVAILARFANDPMPAIARRAVQRLGGLRFTFLDDANRELHARFLVPRLRPVLNRIGLRPIDGESAGIGSLRAALIDVLGNRCEDEEVIAYARELASKAIGNPAAVNADLAPTALAIVAKHGDAALFDAVIDAYRAATVPRYRTMFLNTLAAFSDPELMDRALAYSLSDEVISTQTLGIARTMAWQSNASQKKVTDWLMENFDALEAKVPVYRLASLIQCAGGPDLELLERMKVFVMAPARTNNLVEKNVTETEARSRLSAELRKRERHAVLEALGERAS